MAIVISRLILRLHTSGCLQITGNFDREAAEDLAIALQSGALLVPIRVMSEERAFEK